MALWYLFHRFKSCYNADVAELVIAECEEADNFMCQTSSQPLPQADPEVSTKLKPTWGSMFSRISNITQVETQQENVVRKEVSLYDSLPKLEDKDADPLLWWRLHHTSFPTLAKLAKKYLCIQATSVASERLFSGAGNIVNAKRNCLKPGKVNQLCFLMNNL